MGRSTGYEDDCTLRHDTGARSSGSDRRGVAYIRIIQIVYILSRNSHDGGSFVSCCIAERAERDIERTKCI
jgi:hypothetical protein